MSAEPPDNRAAPEAAGARPSSSFPLLKTPRASARPSSGGARPACTPRARQMKLSELSDSVLFRRQACAHGTARIFGPRANFEAGQLPTLLPGPGGHDGSESDRFDFFILNSILRSLSGCQMRRPVLSAWHLMASTARHATRADGSRPRERRGLAVAALRAARELDLALPPCLGQACGRVRWQKSPKPVAPWLRSRRIFLV